jgi:hypothetical protein
VEVVAGEYILIFNIFFTSNNIYKTSNGGTTWSEILGGYNSYTIYCITFINETGYIGTSNSYAYKSIDFGNTWYTSFNLSYKIYFINMFSKISIVFCTDYQIGLVNDGINVYKYGSGSYYNNCYYYDNNIIVSIYTNNTIHLHTNNANTTTTILSSSNNDIFTSVILINSSTIIVSTNNYYYYVSYNLGSTWFKYTILSPLLYLYKINYKIYGIGFDSNVYVINIINPGSLTVYNNSTALLNYNTDSYFNFNYLSYLNSGNYNLYSVFTSDNNNYLTISSNTLNINVVQPILTSYTTLTLSGIVNHGSTIKLYNNFNTQFNYDYIVKIC